MKIIEKVYLAFALFLTYVPTASAALLNPTDPPPQELGSSSGPTRLVILQSVNYALSLIGLIATIALLIGTIKILYQAFQKNFWQGILCIFVPFYIVYFFFKFYTGKKWWIILTLVSILVVLLVFAVVNTGTSTYFSNFL